MNRINALFFDEGRAADKRKRLDDEYARQEEEIWTALRVQRVEYNEAMAISVLMTMNKVVPVTTKAMLSMNDAAPAITKAMLSMNEAAPATTKAMPGMNEAAPAITKAHGGCITAASRLRAMLSMKAAPASTNEAAPAATTKAMHDNGEMLRTDRTLRFPTQGELDATPLWEKFVSREAVTRFVACLSVMSTESREACVSVNTNEYGVLTADQQDKFFIMEGMLTLMSQTLCEDSRCTGTNMPILVADPLPDEVFTGTIQRFLRVERCFTVNDPLFFDLICRRVQDVHPLFPRSRPSRSRGTKSFSEAFDRAGLGPPVSARAHMSRIGNHRGPRDTDPDHAHPYGPRLDGKHWVRETDMMYFRRFIYDMGRATRALALQ